MSKQRSVRRSALRGLVVVAFGLLAFLMWAPAASAQSGCASYSSCEGEVSDAGVAADSASAAAATTSSSGNLPYTGSDTGRTATIAAAAIVVGGAAVWGSRRARASRTSA